MGASDSTKEGLVFGLDIGTRAVVGVVGYRDKDKFIVKAIESIEHETRAMLDGQIHDIGKVASTIIEIKDRLEKKCKITLKDVCIAAAGRVLKTENIHVDIEYDEETLVLEEQVYDLQAKGVEEAYKKFQNENEFAEKYYCVGKSVIKYFMNDLFILNLLNHKARKVGVDMICTFLPYDVVEGLYAAVEMAGLDVCNLTLEPIAAIEVAIPEKFRMLNIALVDVGAGTSDICITKDGSVVAYGMIPVAGDSLTEKIANHCLVEFNEAEKIKKGIENADEVEYEDILGLTNTISKKEVLELLDDNIKEMAKLASDEITRLNGGTKVSAIFVVGGGGRIEGYTKYLAELHDIMVNRVAVRGEEVMGKIEFKDNSVTKDSLIVTPLGICLHFYEESNSFVNVQINDERLKLYDNGNLSIIDAVMQIGLDNNALFPRRGESLVFKLNGEEKVVKGELGEACQVYLNSELTNLHAPLHANDIIKLVPSTKGANGSMTLARLNSHNPKLSVSVNKMNVTLPNLCTVNGKIAVDSYKIKNGDEVEVLDYLTVGQVLELVDINLAPNETVFVNNEEADLDTKVYSRFNVDIRKAKELTYADLPDDYDYSDSADENDNESTNEVIEDTNKESKTDKDEKSEKTEKKRGRKPKKKVDDAETSEKVSNDETESDSNSDSTSSNEIKSIKVTVNGSVYELKNKSEYVFVDVFDYIDFDLKTPQGSGVATILNGRDAEFLENIHEGDVIEIYWKK